MKNKQTEKQYTIRRLEFKHTQDADKWLRGNGLNAQTFAAESTLVQRAVVAAKTLQREHAQLLKSRDAYTLNEFRCAAATKRTRAKITDGFCYKVLNISTAINRQLFAAQKKLVKAQSNTSNTQSNTNTTQAQ